MTLDELKTLFFGGGEENLESNRLYDWTIEKRNINRKENFPHPKRRQIWWCDIGVNVGQEQGCEDGFERPVLVVQVFGTIFWGLPITSSDPKGKKEKNPLYYKLDNIEYTTPNGKEKSLHGFVALHQMRVFDSRRLKRKILKMELEVFEPIVDKIRELL